MEKIFIAAEKPKLCSKRKIENITASTELPEGKRSRLPGYFASIHVDKFLLLHIYTPETTQLQFETGQEQLVNVSKVFAETFSARISNIISVFISTDNDKHTFALG